MCSENAVGVWVKDDKGLLHKLEAYAETLNGIQKALGEYLEKQRLAFPRFYFVGDEDLLEIIGNAKDPIKVIRHLPKMVLLTVHPPLSLCMSVALIPV
jgi:hypothetical protein